MINRRGFLGTCALVGVSLALSPVKLFAAPFRGSTREGFSPFQPDKQNFQALLNTSFTVHGQGNSSISLKLLEVKDGPASARTEQFALMFRGPRAPSLSEGIYSLEHASAGQFPLFLENVGHDDATRYYRATFSLLI